MFIYFFLTIKSIYNKSGSTNQDMRRFSTSASTRFLPTIQRFRRIFMGTERVSHLECQLGVFHDWPETAANGGLLQIICSATGRKLKLDMLLESYISFKTLRCISDCRKKFNHNLHQELEFFILFYYTSKFFPVKPENRIWF